MIRDVPGKPSENQAISCCHRDWRCELFLDVLPLALMHERRGVEIHRGAGGVELSSSELCGRGAASSNKPIREADRSQPTKNCLRRAIARAFLRPNTAQANSG